MELGSQTCIDRLDPSTDPKLRNIWEKTKLSDDVAIRVITITHEFQTKLGLRRCQKLTVKTFDELATLSVLRQLDLLQTQIASIQPLRHCLHLRNVNLRYTQVRDVRPLENHPSLIELDLGCTKVTNVDALATVPTLTTLFIDDTPVSSVTALLEAASGDSPTSLGTINYGCSDVTPPLRPAWLKIVKDKSRSLAFFTAVMAGNVAKIEKFVAEGQDIDERPFPKLEELVGEKYYTDECKQSTRFFKFDHGARGLRPTALHLACFTGNVPSVKKLIELGASKKLKCWFGKRVPAFNLDEVVDIEANPLEIIRLCRTENIYRRVLKMFETGNPNWKKEVEDRSHECNCAVNGTDPEETERVFYD